LILKESNIIWEEVHF